MNYSLHDVNCISTSDSISLYWNKEEDIPEDSLYGLFMDGNLVGTTKKTHYTFEHLKEACDYQVQVVIDGPQSSRCFSEALTVRTLPKKNRIDITKPPYLAVGDGKTMNTDKLQRAIDDCGQNEMVYIPEGVFLTGALRLHSDMELYLEEGAVLQGTEQVDDYLPRIPSRFEGIEMECYSSLLNLGYMDHNGGYNCCNVVIRGKGTIRSGGRVLARNVIESEKERLKDYLHSLGDKIKDYEKADTIPGRVRPRLVNMSNCQNILLTGVSLENGASWNVHMIYSDQIVTHNCTFRSEGVWNGDGWDPDSSTNCTIFNCVFHTGDDSIAIKSGKNPQGNKINRPSEHIKIFDCYSACGHGFTIGSEMSGGINDVAIWDCDVSHSLCGIEIKGTKKRGGFVRNVSVRNCATARILFHSVDYNNDGIGAPVPPVFEHCLFDGIKISGEYYGEDNQWHACRPIELCGFDECGYYVKDIVFSNIKIRGTNTKGDQTIALKYCENITFKNICAD